VHLRSLGRPQALIARMVCRGVFRTLLLLSWGDIVSSIRLDMAFNKTAHLMWGSVTADVSSRWWGYLLSLFHGALKSRASI
jgi:hypothetical protein